MKKLKKYNVNFKLTSMKFSEVNLPESNNNNNKLI